jgi:hypothetical protein
MAQIFHPAANTIAKATIFGALFIAGAAAMIIAEITRSPYVTQVNIPRDQPVPFSHEHHVKGLGIDCRMCHTSVEESPFAGLPTTKHCMTCHSQIWTNAEMLEPVRTSWRTRQPLQWTRVHDLPDFSYFDHSIHIAKGVGCVSCHGQVDQMPLMWQTQSLQMEWCLSCHRDPAPNLRPRDQVFNMNWDAKEAAKAANMTPREYGDSLVKKHGINLGQLTNCSVCHR